MNNYTEQSTCDNSCFNPIFQPFHILHYASFWQYPPWYFPCRTSGRVSFWGDAYTTRKWTRNLRYTKIPECVPTKFQKTPLPPSNDSAKYWNVVCKGCALSFHAVLVCLPWLFALMCSLRCVETGVPLVAYTVRTISMILHTARFLCVLITQTFAYTYSSSLCLVFPYLRHAKDKINDLGRAAKFFWTWAANQVSSLALSHPMITLKFLLQPHGKYYITQYEEVGFSCFTWMKDDYTSNTRWGECPFQSWE